MKTFSIFFLIFCLLTLSGCPHEPDPEERFQVFITNQSQDTLRFLASFRFIDNDLDTLIEEASLRRIYEDLSESITLNPMDTAALLQHDRAAMETGLAPILYTIFNVDTLETLSMSEVLQTERGASKHLFRTIEDFERINFTVVHP